MSSSTLRRAKKAKDDEFYTAYEDVQKEVDHYADCFKGKTVYCPCDNPHRSNFTRYFLLNFKRLGLRRLICTSYNSQELPLGQGGLFAGKMRRGLVLDVSVGTSERRLESFIAKHVNELKGDGDFRSNECSHYFEQADAVVTNPPFSLIQPFFARASRKQYLFICPITALDYASVFPYIKRGLARTGYTYASSPFIRDDGSTERLSNCVWLTNLPVDFSVRRKPECVVYKPGNYEKYDATYYGQPILHIKSNAEIPSDYYGLMGVPLTFLCDYDTSDFEVVARTSEDKCSVRRIVNGKFVFSRIIVRRHDRKKDKSV